MLVKDIVLPMPMISFDTAVLGAAYALLTAAGGITKDPFLIRYTNNSDKDVTVSYDGVTDHDFIPAGTSVRYDFTTNAQPANYRALLAKGTQIWIKGSAGTGSFYLSAFYQPSLN